jgi:eukaryotic-like serine/threonine-protein kinase
MVPPLPSDIFAPGQVLNNTYEVEGVIGRGGTGEVYRARNAVTGRRVAIKALSRQFSGNSAYLELMRREEQMRDVLHDAVVRYTECSRAADGTVFLVMDLVEGPTLQAEMTARRMGERELLIVAHRVAEGLAAAHARGIVHRDLSPDNIVLRDGAPERATIIDFGIAKDTGAGARTIVGNDFAGKYEYAAPEQMEGRAEPRSDLYALGASLLAAWRGEVPFAGATPGEMVRLKTRPLDVADLPAGLRALIASLTEPDPARRPASARELLDRIEPALRSGPAPRERGRPAAARRGGVARALLLGFLLIALAGGGLWAAARVDPRVGAWLEERAGPLRDRWLLPVWDERARPLLARWFPPELPTADPYVLTAASDGTLSGAAPDADAAVAIRRAQGTATGEMPPEEAVTVALGVPSDRWAEGVAGLIAGTAGLEEWALSVEDEAARLVGLAPDLASREAVATALGAAATAGGLTLSLDLAAGPRVLREADLAPALGRAATCGPLHAEAPEGGWALGAAVRVEGSLPDAAAAEALRGALAPLVGDRAVELRADLLNPELCTVRAVLPAVEPVGLSIRLGDGATGEARLTGVFRAGENPVAVLEMPASLEEGYLWAVAVDNDGVVYNLLPNAQDEENRIARIGVVEGGVRRVTLLRSLSTAAAETGARMGFEISEDNFGKTEVLALVTRDQLFAARGPESQSAALFAEELAKALSERPDAVVALASRVVEARP